MKNILVFAVATFFLCSACSDTPPESRLVVEGGQSGAAFGSGYSGQGVPPVREAIDEPDSDGNQSDSFTEDSAIVDATDTEDISEDATSPGGESDGVGEDTSGSPDGVSVEDGSSDTSDSEEPESTTIDVSNVECLFIPDFGVFNPVMECYWDASHEFEKYDDVVMTPVVANLTDDDLDGDVDTQDIPDIAFISYRYQQDGCCNAPGVLRIISGSCNAGAASVGQNDPKLAEHVTVDAFQLDNSAGLAVGDVDDDGQMEIYAMKKNSGSVLYSGIEYPEVKPEDAFLELSKWTSTGNDIAGALSENDGDNSAIETEESEITLMCGGVFSEAPLAISGLRVRLTARTEGNTASLAGKIELGDEAGNEIFVEESASRLFSSEEFVTIRFNFPHNKSSGEERQWQQSDLENLRFGIVNKSESGAKLIVTEMVLEVGSVFLEWESDFPKAADLAKGAQPSIVDLNQDGIAELLVGRVLIDSETGSPLWTGNAGTGINGFIGPISFAADLDLDGTQEVIAGDTIYGADGSVSWQVDYGDDGTGCKSGGLPCDGFNAVGNFDEDPEGEIVTVRNGMLFVLEHTGEQIAKLKIPKTGCDKNEGGPPTIADFDNDGEAEIGVAGANYYIVADWECCDNPLDCASIPASSEAECEEPGIRWKVPNKDCSSRVTGSSVFDFQGDGAAEVVYNDEELFRIFNGDTGEVLVEVENKSHTRLEYPVIVDTDRDGNAEIVFVENKDDATPIQIWGDATDNWVPTRTIWNQHAYHISNINEDGTLPEPGLASSWLSHNTFRQNLPDFDPFLAPDLQAEWIGVQLEECPDVLILEGKVCNGGLLWSAGIDVRIFDGLGQPVTCSGGMILDKSLESGECTQVLCRVEEPGLSIQDGNDFTLCVDGFDASCAGPGWSNECDETNNKSVTDISVCP